MNLSELLTRVDELSLAASGLACLDRCVPLLGADDVLRPLWARLGAEAVGGADTESDSWGALLADVRDELPKAPEAAGGRHGEAAALTLGMLESAPGSLGQGARVWAESCSLAALRVHALVDPADRGAPVTTLRDDPTAPASPLVAAELRHQTQVLRLLTDHGTTALRQVLETSTEGRRVLRAVLSRRSRSS